ncbi:uncharacterized protein LOC128670379 [Plodia interpunctella]|uniref:uncharacterized protein LOC128670379 n=1 Tax=Plodia interpunctella TaxID=58824 RepID=UPI00236743E3|nr:uncharacterized protein LOC128670379 [Plodia interpunctella]
MKSKSFDLKRSPAEKVKHNKTFDFISLYKSAADTVNVAINESGDGIDKENSYIKSQNETPRQDSSHNKKKKRSKHEPLDISRINIEGPMLEPNLSNSPLNQSKATSTPRPSNNDKNHVKSIMKNSIVEDTVDSSYQYHNSNPKKRNKSVSFMLEDNEDVVPKKTKSEESLGTGKKKHKDQSKPAKEAKTDNVHERKPKKLKKQQMDKHKVAENNNTVETDPMESSEKKVDFVINGDADGSSMSNENKKLDKKKRVKIFTNQKRSEIKAAMTEKNNNEETSDNKNRKVNKKKRKEKPTKPTDGEIDEPAAKTRKKEVVPEVIAENLENLTIGDNPHTLTSLLDEMTVADKGKKKKNKRKQKKDKVNSAEVENTEVKEKVKWGKKWNKAKKGGVSHMKSSVDVENLPLSLICSYKQVLAERFEKYGVIKKIGVAEVYPRECTGFTTTVHFETEAAATAALSEDGAVVNGNSILVKRPLPPSETTLVVRSYAMLSDQSISTTFSEHGRIRNIRRPSKGKKSMDTVFIEFDGPRAVERAIELSKGAKVAGKQIHVAKFEVRKKKVKPAKAKPVENDGEADSEDSN